MDLVVAFCVFVGTMAYVLASGYAMAWGMLAGLAAFFAAALHRGFAFADVARMSWRGALKTLVVVRILIIIGVLTGMWRVSGTFAILVSWGIRLITPHLFILISYLLCVVLSYGIGTSFGVAGTLGITLMTLSKSSGVDPLITAGAIVSGIYFGDRCSPASSCALLVAGVTDTELYDNLRTLHKTALLPLLITIAVYAALSFANPMTAHADAASARLAEGFSLTPWVAFPAAVMLALPLMGISPVRSFACSIAASAVCAWLFQGFSPLELLRVAVFGLHEPAESARALFNGGGIVSMINMAVIVFISGTYSGIFDGTGMLATLQSCLSRLIARFGAYPVIACTGALMDGVFCNQTIGIMMTSQLLARPYEDTGRTKAEFAQDISNSTAILAALMPTCIACSVPYAMFGVPMTAIPYAVYIYILPVCYLFTKKRWFKKL